MNNYSLNYVKGFQPFDMLSVLYDVSGEPIRSKITGEPVKVLRTDAKKTWFRMVFPEGATVIDIIENTDTEVTVKASVYKNTETNQLPLGTGYSTQLKLGERQYPPLETAATIALGNALDDAGFGCEISQSLNCDIQYLGAAKEETLDCTNEEEDAKPQKKPKLKSLKDAKEAEILTDEEDVLMSHGVVPPKRKDKLDNKEGRGDAKSSEAEEIIENIDENTKEGEKELHENRQKKESIASDEKMSMKIKGQDLSAHSYVITEGDTGGSFLMSEYVGKRLEEIEKDKLILILDRMGMLLSDKLKENIEKLVYE